MAKILRGDFEQSDYQKGGAAVHCAPSARRGADLEEG